MFRYLQDKEFRQQYHEAKKARLDAALADLQKASSEAVSTLREVMGDRESGASSRVQAARAVLGFGIQTGQVEDLMSRLEAVEERLEK